MKFKFTVVMVSVSCSQGLSWIKSCVLLEMVMVCRRSQQQYWYWYWYLELVLMLVHEEKWDVLGHDIKVNELNNF